MLKIRERFRQIITYNLSDEEFHVVKQRIEKKNINNLKYFSVVILGIFSFLYITTFFVSESIDLTALRLFSRNIYFSVIIISFISFVLSFKFLPKHPSLALVLWYFTLFCLYIFAIWIGVIGQKHFPAVTFCVFLLALPLLMIDNLIQTQIFLIFICIIFVFSSYYVKDFDIFSFDLGNCTTFFLMSSAISYYTRNTAINEIKKEIKLEEQRDIDELSLLFNKNCFEKKLQAMVKDKGVLLILDIDNFKNINDSFGHLYGDGIIHTVGKSLKEVFSEKCVVGRFGGDEFVVYMNYLPEITEIENKLELLGNKINDYVLTSNHSTKVTLSCGGAIYKKDGNDYLSLFKVADNRLYDVKNEKKGSLKIDN